LFKKNLVCRRTVVNSRGGGRDGGSKRPHQPSKSRPSKFRAVYGKRNPWRKKTARRGEKSGRRESRRSTGGTLFVIRILIKSRHPTTATRGGGSRESDGGEPGRWIAAAYYSKRPADKGYVDEPKKRQTNRREYGSGLSAPKRPSKFTQPQGGGDRDHEGGGREQGEKK